MASTAQCANTSGFNGHVFAATALLSYRVVPRIRDLPSNELYLFDPSAAPKEIRVLVRGKIIEKLITENWKGILRAAASMEAGVMPPSQLLRKFASYPRQHELALTLRKIGRIACALFPDRSGFKTAYSTIRVIRNKKPPTSAPRTAPLMRMNCRSRPTSISIRSTSSSLSQFDITSVA